MAFDVTEIKKYNFARSSYFSLDIEGFPDSAFLIHKVHLENGKVASFEIYEKEQSVMSNLDAIREAIKNQNKPSYTFKCFMPNGEEYRIEQGQIHYLNYYADYDWANVNTVQSIKVSIKPA
jgi:hypothetical protein